MNESFKRKKFYGNKLKKNFDFDIVFVEERTWKRKLILKGYEIERNTKMNIFRGIKTFVHNKNIDKLKFDIEQSDEHNSIHALRARYTKRKRDNWDDVNNSSYSAKNWKRISKRKHQYKNSD